MFGSVGARRLLAVTSKQQQRGLAAAAAEGKLPVQLYGLSARYANALFLAAQKAGELPKVEENLNEIRSWTSSNAEFKEYIHNPVISRVDKVKDMATVSKGMAATTQGLLGIMAENGRLGEIESVIKTFDILISAQRGILEATVTSAEPLTAKQLKSVQKAVTGGYLEKGQTLNLQSKVDPTIIGGLQVQIGDKFLDLSVQKKINGISQVLK